MYMPPQFNARDPAIALDLMRAHPFASLVSNDDDGLPFVTHLPLVAEPGPDDSLVPWATAPSPIRTGATCRRGRARSSPSWGRTPTCRPRSTRTWHACPPGTAGIVGFELRVTSLQCKVKLNQHRRESHAAMHAVYGAGTPDERALAAWMERLGMPAEATAAEGH